MDKAYSNAISLCQSLRLNFSRSVCWYLNSVSVFQNIENKKKRGRITKLKKKDKKRMDTWVKRRPLFCSAKWAHKSGTAQYEVQLTPMSADYRPRSLTPVYSCHRWTVVTEAFDSPIFFYKRKSGNVLLDLVTAVFINSSGGPAATLTNHNHGLCCFLFWLVCGTNLKAQL